MIPTIDSALPNDGELASKWAEKITKMDYLDCPQCNLKVEKGDKKCIKCPVCDFLISCTNCPQ